MIEAVAELDDPRERRRVLRYLGDELVDLQGLVKRYDAESSLRVEGSAIGREAALLAAREDATVREELIRRGMADERALDEAGVLTHEEVDAVEREWLPDSELVEGFLGRLGRAARGAYKESLHPRDRTGKFREKPGAPVPAKKAAAVSSSAPTPSTPSLAGSTPGEPPLPDRAEVERIRKMPLTDALQAISRFAPNDWPPKGAASQQILGEAKDTEELWKRDGKWKAERLPVHRRIVGQTLAGAVDSLLGDKHPITVKLNKGGELTAEDRDTIRAAASRARQGGAPQVLFMAGGPGPLALDTPIATPSGWSTMGQIEVGDYVFGEDGAPLLVDGVTPVFLDRECFRVEFSDGTTIVADSSHLWTTQTRLERRKAARRADPERGAHYNGSSWVAQYGPTYLGSFQSSEEASAVALAYRLDHGHERGDSGVRTTAEIAASLRYGSDKRLNHSIACAGPLRTPEAILPIDPYLLGAWLGDGHSASGLISCSDDDARIIEEIRAAGYSVTRRERLTCPAWRVDGLTTELRRLGVLGNKHVPSQYLRASERQRRALLAGMLDTDGHAHPKGGAEFYACRRELAEAVFELAASLGYRPVMREGRAKLYGRDCGPKWTVSFTTDVSPFRLPRKRDRHRPASRSGRRYVVAVTPVESVPVRCISVDSESHLFLAGRSMIPTHNSGKTTALDASPEMHLPHSFTVNPDDIKEQLPEYGDMVKAKDKYAASAVHEESSYLGKLLQELARDLDLNVVIDGTGNSGDPSKFAGKFQQMHDSGYEVSALYVNVPTDVALVRAMTRAAGSGRWVPEPEIRTQHRNVSRNFDEVLKLDFVKSLKLFDSDVAPGEPPLLVASGPGSGGAPQNPGGLKLEVHDRNAMDRFIAKQKEGKA